MDKLTLVIAQTKIVILHAKRGLMDFTKKRAFFFTVTVSEFEFSQRELKISRHVHSAP